MQPVTDDQFRTQVEDVLAEIRPYIQRDGGDIELVKVVGRSVHVQLTGHCVGCPSAMITLRHGVEQRLRESIPEFEELVPVGLWD